MPRIKCLLCKENKKCKKFLAKTKKTYSKNKAESCNMTFSSLTPLDDLEAINDKKSNTYYKALNYALAQENIHNIAITGTYGAGKSSVIDSYFRNTCRKEFLKISLATFYLEKKDEKSKPLDENKIIAIEKSILQQMFYRRKANAFPFSRIKRIKSYDWYIILFIEICIIASILFICSLLKIDFSTILSDFYNIPILKKLPLEYILKILSYGTFAFLGYYIIRFFLKVRLIKFSFQKMELGIDDIDSESLLNKYIDEILYFFEKTKIRTVVFEDLDRFNEPEIFFHLRELNSLINNYEKIKKKVVFIYALKDEIFDDVDRTKFFDFIIPIVPVIDVHNSKNIIFKKQMNIRSLSKIDETFINDISKYIKDMRLLINCINEFQIYDEVIESNNKTNLFALILYKNFYPHKFAELTDGITKIKKENVKEVKTLEDFLIKKGFITEKYIYNISRYYFRDDGNKETDREFLDLVENNKNPKFNLQLTDKENVVAKIKSKKWWSNKAILNNDLLDFLLKNQKDYFEENLEQFIATMYSYDKYHYKNRFFIQYEHKNITKEETDYFYRHINKYIQSDSDLSYNVFFDVFESKAKPSRLEEFLLSVDSFDDKFKDFVRDRIDFLTPSWDIIYSYFIKIDNKEKTKLLGTFINVNKKFLKEVKLDKEKKDEMVEVGYLLP